LTGLTIKDVDRTEMRRYSCPFQFRRSGNSCYHFGKEKVTWHDAHFKCRNMGSKLAVVDKRAEDKYLKMMLNKKMSSKCKFQIISVNWHVNYKINHLHFFKDKQERWIGGIYDWAQGVWVWGASGKRLRYQGFSRRQSHFDYTWHCIMMDPKMLFR
jgi:hypothetical protein